MTGGVRTRFWGAGDAGALRFSTFRASPSGFLMTMAALFRGLVKVDGSGLAFGCGARVWAGAMEGVWGWPVLEAGRGSDTWEELRDMGCA
jgi:hypothetical protein